MTNPGPRHLPKSLSGMGMDMGMDMDMDDRQYENWEILSKFEIG